MALCLQCGNKCGLKKEDIGIGPYEYWGARGVHSEIIYVSDCCEDDVELEYGEKLKDLYESDLYDDY